MANTLYTSGDYLQRNPGWHVEESPWKARQVLRIMRANSLAPGTICEVGCGVGEILKQLQEQMAEQCLFYGYDISPQAIALAQTRANARLHFKLADITHEHDVHFEVMLLMDVIEHIEDYFRFLRALKAKSDYKILHIPLDLSVQTLVRPGGLLKVRREYGHIHYFTREIALQMLQEVGYTIVDSFYTASSLEIPTAVLTRKLLRLPRKLFFRVHQDLAAHILGGFRLLVLAT